MPGKSLAHLANKFRFLHCFCAYDQEVNSRLEVSFNNSSIADSTPQLNCKLWMPASNLPDRISVNRPAFKCPIEINKVHSVTTLTDPVIRHADRVI